MTMVYDICKHITKRFEKIRAYHVNKARFAKDIGMNRQTVVNFAKGKIKNPSIFALLPMADYFKVSLDELVGRIPPTKSSISKPLFLSQDVEFNKKLFLAITDVIFKHIEKNKIEVSFDKILSALDGIYEYSIKQNKDTPDLKFAKWLLDKLFS